MDKIKFYFQQSWLLITASLVFGILLAVLNAAWMPIIKQNEIKKFNRLAGALFTTNQMPAENITFVPLDEKLIITSSKGKTRELEVKTAFFTPEPIDPESENIEQQAVEKGTKIGFAWDLTANPVPELAQALTSQSQRLFPASLR